SRSLNARMNSLTGSFISEPRTAVFSESRTAVRPRDGPERARTKQVGGCREVDEGSAHPVRDPRRPTEDPAMRRLRALSSSLALLVLLARPTPAGIVPADFPALAFAHRRDHLAAGGGGRLGGGGVG